MIKTAIKITGNWKAVDKRLDQNTKKAFLYIGGAIRRNAKSSIRKGSKGKPYSAPGKPPHSRTGILKKSIGIDYDPSKRSVAVGPIVNRRVRRDGATTNRKTTVSALEYGGKISSPRPTRIPAEFAGTNYRRAAWKRINARRRKQRRRRIKLSEVKYVTIPAGRRTLEPRPLMRPALEKTMTASNESLRRAFARAGVPQRSRNE